MKIEVLELAKQEFDEAFSHYESKEIGLGIKFQKAINAQIQSIRSHPDAWMLIRPGIRKCLGKRFPYDLIYELRPGKIIVLAVAHQKRRPHYWANRDRNP
jgi:plasmid stabilization system protein ParE